MRWRTFIFSGALGAAVMISQSLLAADRVVLREGYNLRMTPSMSGDIVRQTGAGESFKIVDRGNGWTLIRIGPKRYWVHSSAIEETYDTSDSDSGTEACPSCSRAEQATSKPGPVQTQTQNLSHVNDREAEGHQLPPRDFPAACNHFITKDGLGDYGRLMIDAAHRVAKDCMYNSRVFRNVCSNFQSLPPEKKNAVLALVFASMAKDESHCSPAAQNTRGTNGTADGLYQLEFSQRLRSWRSKEWCAADRSVDTQDLRFQSECSVSIIDDTACKLGKALDAPVRVYWEGLTNHGKVAQLIETTARAWGICK